MRFPETPRTGTEGHRDAVRRLEEAKADQHQTSERHDAATGTIDERAAADDLAASRERLAAREAWVNWVERGY
jgi:hypothetical protein